MDCACGLWLPMGTSGDQISLIFPDPFVSCALSSCHLALPAPQLPTHSLVPTWPHPIPQVSPMPQLLGPMAGSSS